ncbi:MULTISPECIES: exosome complex protein Rrp42 [Metallosphaera]|uniref:Exosome complex component Rrp42 n=1 Tax=Metallosphaera cuprina (strain Ar-4) TaxID=1006006 RepID=F4G1S4_METCR|nr:exosome complex protein Rrp42 [Metallosphaera cuprina]AEB96081.1 exosome complex RNA-binding protein Rrp42 [Metallosphaera cuprina Ar-4]
MSMTPTKENVVPLIKKESIISLLERGSRNDGRKFNDYRPLSITLGYAKKADGSALVKLGDTTVLAGVKIEEDEPYSDTPNQGNLVVNAELLPLAYETFEPGPPDENAIELSRVVDRSLRDSKAVDLSALVIEPGKRVWTVWVDISVLDYGGNILDACTLSAVAALYDTKLPRIVNDNGTINIVKEDKTTPFPIRYPVATVTIAKLGKFLVVDPDLEEEGIMDAKISFSYIPDGHIVGIQKSGEGSFSQQEIEIAENTSRTVSQKMLEDFKNIMGIKVVNNNAS